MATMKMNTPMIRVQIMYGRPVRFSSVEPPVAKATAGATHMTVMYSTSKSVLKIGEYLP